MTDTPTLDSIQAELDKLKQSQTGDENESDLPYVVIRTYSAGVHAGYLKRLDETTQTVELINTRRIFRWSGALTLSEVSKNGVTSQSKLSEEIEKIILLEAIEVLFTTQQAKTILRSFKNG
jgi:site-specific recombinase XerD